MTPLQFTGISIITAYFVVVIAVVTLIIKVPFVVVQYAFWNWANKRFKINLPVEELSFVNVGVRAFSFATAFIAFAYLAGDRSSEVSFLSPNLAPLSLICFLPGLIGILCDAAIMAWKQKKVTPLFGLLSISINTLSSAYSFAAVSYLSHLCWDGGGC